MNEKIDFRDKFNQQKWTVCGNCGRKLKDRYYGYISNGIVMAICEKCSQTHEWFCYTIHIEQKPPVNVFPKDNRDLAIARSILIGDTETELREKYCISKKEYDIIYKKAKEMAKAKNRREAPKWQI